jgi:hypothetical protein
MTAARTCDNRTCRRPLPKGRRRFCSDQCAREYRPDPKRCEGPRCTNVLTGAQRRFCSADCARRSRRADRPYDPGEVGANIVRLVRSMSRRAGVKGEAEFGALWKLRKALDRAIVDAYDANRNNGVELDRLAAEAGVSRQALAQWVERRGSTVDGQRNVARHAGGDDLGDEVTSTAAG